MELNDTLWDLAQQAVAQKIQYDFGGKDPMSGRGDCSGWVSHMLNSQGIPVDAMNTSAADLAYRAHKGGYLNSLQDAMTLAPGQLIFGAGGEHAKKRFKGIGHIGYTTQGKDGQLYVSELASSRGGASITPLDEWFQRFPISYNADIKRYLGGKSQPRLADVVKR